jgi:hypothetical protein
MASLIASLSVFWRGDAAHLGAEQLHALDVEVLAAHVLHAHVDHALQSEMRGAAAVATPCWPAPVSAMTRFAHAGRQQRLADRVLILWAPVWSRSSRLR